ncbi:MFS transporter [Gordonia soli]|uniref:MFS transporter n=1 Tax=Gordonia soli TaxID=320799 RepID=UPI0012FCE182|nr:MFS transporter [Gordonia soli]
MLAFAGLGFEGFFVGALSGGMSTLKEQLGLDGDAVGTFSGLGYAASIVAALACARIGDRVGRVRLLVGAKVLAVIGATVMATAGSFDMLLAGRVTSGIAYGIDLGIALAYLAEFLPKARRNWLNFSQAQWYTSTSLALLVTLVVTELGAGLDTWRWVLGVAAVVAFVLFLCRLIFMPESARWLAARGDLPGAARSLTRLYREPFVAEAAASAPAPAVTVPWSALWTPGYRRRTVLANIVGFTEALQYFAIAFYLPIISLELFGGGITMAIAGSLVFNVFGIIGGFLAVRFTQRLGLRVATAWGYAGVAVSILVLALWTDIPLWAGFLVPSVFIFCHAIAPGTAGLTMGSLAYRSELRARGSQLVTISRSAAGVTGLYCFPVLQSAVGTSTTLLIFLVAAPLTGLVACLVITWEPLSNESDRELDMLSDMPSRPVARSDRSMGDENEPESREAAHDDERIGPR